MTGKSRKLRFERKYLLDKDTAFLLKQRLSYVLKPDENNTEGAYKVSSVYFDDDFNTALFEKQNGILNRAKFRMRYYNECMDTIHLECKQKHGDMIYKEHKPLTITEYNMLLGGDFGVLRDDIFQTSGTSALLTKLYTTHLRKQMHPVVTVEYDRQAYIHPMGDVRITFDSNITAKSPASATSFVVLPQHREVLEIKYTHFIPSMITGLLSGFQLTQQLPVSKYVMSRLAIQGKQYTRLSKKGVPIQ